MVDNLEYGYEKTRFPKLEDESFDCVICSEVVKNPKECTVCGSLFCTPCINSWLVKSKQCPNRCNYSIDSIKPIGRALLKIYNDLDIQCKHHDKCNQVLKLADLDKHEKTCQLPKCKNFDVCGNNLPANSMNETCSLECVLILQIKSANGDWAIIYKNVKEYIEPLMVPKTVVSKPLNEVKPSVVVPNPNNGSIVTFRWDSKHCGTNIQLTENGCLAYLKEPSYIFKTVLGEYGFMNGVHYWEIQADPRTENELKIGVSVKQDFDANSAFCDFEFGYAYYGLGQLRHNSNANGPAYGKKFKKEGVLGICLDMNKGTLTFGMDGASFGVAFTSEALKKGPIFPAVALLHNAGCKLISGKPVPAYFMK